MTNVQRLQELGQSIWYDNISRPLIRGGELARHVEEGLTGVTSNPTIFDKAITGGNDYDDEIREILERQPKITSAGLIQALMITDIQQACDVLTGVYERTGGRDGFVSIEVAPGKARDTRATVEEVRFLWSRVNRKNLMIKIPATKEGLPAIEQCVAEGVNINITLIFAVQRYREVAIAYLSGLERRLREGKPIAGVASVASVFVSRIDTLVDEMLQAKGSSMPPADATRISALAGRAAVANTKMVYQVFREIFEGPRFKALAQKGAALQRPLWGSTGTKNPRYSDLHYVDPLIGRHTVNTVPPVTYHAILDHGTPKLTIESELDAARAVLHDVEVLGISMDAVTTKLEQDGVAAFEKSFDALSRSLENKRREFAAEAVPRG